MTFPIERLKAIKTIISHETCADGLASAMILKAAFIPGKPGPAPDADLGGTCR